MARDRLTEELEQLRALRGGEPGSPEGLALLRKMLGGRRSHAAAEAARIVGEGELEDLTSELLDAFERLMQPDPVKRDPGCRAKTEIIEALQRLEYPVADPFLRGIRHIQMEPVYGGRQDTAPPLRQASAYGLVRMRYADLMVELSDLLADVEPTARIGAARALGYSGRVQGVPLLRLKVRLGDADASVTSECMASLIELESETGIPFVASFLSVQDAATAEAAALALGGSRQPQALSILQAWWPEAADDGLRSTGLLSIAMVRSDEALEYLVGLLASEPGPTARLVLRALALYRHDDRLWDRVERCARERDDVDLGAELEEIV